MLNFSPAWQSCICKLLLCSSFVFPASHVPTLTGNHPLNSEGVGIISKCMDVRIVTAPSDFALIPKVLLHWILTKPLGEHKLCTLNSLLSCHPYALICLPGEERAASSILCEVPWSVISTLFPNP